MSAGQTRSSRSRPELREWIVEQAQAGHRRRACSQSMLASGWQRRRRRSRRWRPRCAAHLPSSRAPPQGLPAAAPCRCPTGSDESPLYIDAGDRRVQVLQTMRNPRVIVFGDLLSDEECDGLIAAGRRAWRAR